MTMWASLWPSTGMPARSMTSPSSRRVSGRPSLERASHGVAGHGQLPRVEAKPRQPAARRRQDTRRGQAHQPADIRRQHVVPRRPQDVRAQDLPGGECRVDVRLACSTHAQAERPLGQLDLLRLHRQERADDLLGRLIAVAREALVAQAQAPDIGRLHPDQVCLAGRVLALLEDREDVAGRVLEPGDRLRAVHVRAHDALGVGLEVGHVVMLHRHALRARASTA